MFTAVLHRFAIADVVNEACTSYATSTGVSSVACSRLKKIITESMGGNPGRRAGYICQAMTLCQADQLANCTLTAASLSANLSRCTIEGIRTGTAVTGITQDTSEYTFSPNSMSSNMVFALTVHFSMLNLVSARISCALCGQVGAL